MALSDEDCRAAVAAYVEHGRDAVAAARATGQARNTFANRLMRAAERGMMLGEAPAMPGYAVKSVSENVDGKWVKQTKAPGEVFAVPDGMRLKGVSALTDGEGRVIQQWNLARDGGERDPLAIAESLKAAFSSFEPAAIPSIPLRADGEGDKLLNIVPAGDWHFGLHVWGRQAENDWDLKIAEPTIGDAAVEAIQRAPLAGVGVLLGGGDLLHSDSSKNATFKGTPVDVDGRYQKIIEATTRVKVRVIDAMLLRHGRVIVRILPGNHDRDACVAIVYFLKAWYRNDPRVLIDTDPSDFWWMPFGACLFGAAHGDRAKVSKMPGIMASRRAADWGSSRFRYVHGFHLHHSVKFADEDFGVVSEVHQAPIPQDSWHYGEGYMSGRSIQSITYHAGLGEYGRSRVPILDGAKL